MMIGAKEQFFFLASGITPSTAYPKDFTTYSVPWEIFTTRSSCSLEECDQGFTQAWSLMFVYQMSVSIRLEDLSESYVSVLRNLSLF